MAFAHEKNSGQQKDKNDQPNANADIFGPCYRVAENIERTKIKEIAQENIADLLKKRAVRKDICPLVIVVAQFKAEAVVGYL